MNREPAYTFDRFMHELFEQARWKKEDITFVAALERVRAAYPKRKFTRAEFLQRKHQYAQGVL